MESGKIRISSNNIISLCLFTHEVWAVPLKSHVKQFIQTLIWYPDKHCSTRLSCYQAFDLSACHDPQAKGLCGSEYWLRSG